MIVLLSCREVVAPGPLQGGGLQSFTEGWNVPYLQIRGCKLGFDQMGEAIPICGDYLVCLNFVYGNAGVCIHETYY